MPILRDDKGISCLLIIPTSSYRTIGQTPPHLCTKLKSTVVFERYLSKVQFRVVSLYRKGCFCVQKRLFIEFYQACTGLMNNLFCTKKQPLLYRKQPETVLHSITFQKLVYFLILCKNEEKFDQWFDAACRSNQQAWNTFIIPKNGHFYCSFQGQHPVVKSVPMDHCGSYRLKTSTFLRTLFGGREGVRKSVRFVHSWKCR